MTDLIEKWVNIYKSKKYGDSYWTGVFGYRTKEDAIEDLEDKENYLTTINIEEVLKLQEQNAELEDTIEALKSELKEVCDVLIRKCPEMKDWVMMNWKNLYEVQDE